MPNIQDVSEAGDKQFARMLLYAHPGWRKTSLIGDGTLRTLIIRSPMDQIPSRILKNKSVKVLTINTWEEAMGDSDSALEYIRYEGHNYDWVWMDCISIIQDVLLDDIWAATKAEKPFRAVLTPSGGLDRGEYWRNMERIQQFVRHACGAKTCNFGITAHVSEGAHPEREEGHMLLPWIHGKGMIPKISGYMNMVAYYQLKEKDDKTWSRMHTRESPDWYAKDLFDAYPKGYVDNPSMKQILEAINATRESQPTSGRSRGRPTKQVPARGRGRAVAGRRER